MGTRIPHMPLLACRPNELISYNAESGNWQCALPHSSPHYLADQDRWVLCPGDWVLTRNVITGQLGWKAPHKSPA
jgi:hypothetical protein